MVGVPSLYDIVFLISDVCSLVSTESIWRMIDAAAELLLGHSSLFSLVLRFICAIRKKGLPMFLANCSPPFSPSFSSSPTPNINSFRSPDRTVYGDYSHREKIAASFTNPSVDSSSGHSWEINQTERSRPGAQRPSLCSRRPEFSPGSLRVVANRGKPVEDGESLLSRPLDSVNDQCVPLNSTMSLASKGLSSMARKKPARILIPEASVVLEEVYKESGDQREVVVAVGQEFFVASRRGRSRKNMEDKYAVITDSIASNSKQAFFGVFDGHGGQEAVDFIADRLGKNIVGAMKETREEDDDDDRLEMATKIGYKTTDDDFFAQGLRGGACAATVLIKDGEAQVANVGDCRVVLSRNCLAHALTNDHRVDRHDERCRIESSGGYVNVHNGVWRVQGSLAVSRAIGDSHLKKWVISEPETSKVRLTTECQFFIIASDGLWDKVTNQEAVDVVLKHGASFESCKVLVELSCMRGNMDDITVMVVDLGSFI